MSGQQSNLNPTAQLAIYGLPAAELQQMIDRHIDSITRCIMAIDEAMRALPEDADADAPPELRRKALFESELRNLAVAKDEAEYLLRHIPLEHRFMLTATQILGFRTRWGELKVDVEKMAMAPRSAAVASEQAERVQSSLITATPRIVLASQ